MPEYRDTIQLLSLMYNHLNADEAEKLFQDFHAHLASWRDNGVPFDIRDFFRTRMETLFENKFEANSSSFLLRETTLNDFGYVLPALNFPTQIGRFGPVLEVGAGRGFLSAVLSHAGVDVIATDPKPWPGAKHVQPMDGSQSIKEHCDRAVLCAWPGYQQPWLNTVALSIPRGQYLLIVGEDAGGCTGHDTLWDVLEDHFYEVTTPEDTQAVISWPNIHDRLRVWQRVTERKTS